MSGASFQANAGSCATKKRLVIALRWNGYALFVSYISGLAPISIDSKLRSSQARRPRCSTKYFRSSVLLVSRAYQAH